MEQKEVIIDDDLDDRINAVKNNLLYTFKDYLLKATISGKGKMVKWEELREVLSRMTDQYLSSAVPLLDEEIKGLYFLYWRQADVAGREYGVTEDREKIAALIKKECEEHLEGMEQYFITFQELLDAFDEFGTGNEDKQKELIKFFEGLVE